MQLCVGTSAAVATAHGNIEIFSTSGVLQCDTLAPFLFINLLDYILRETILNNIDSLTITPRRRSHYPAVRMGALVYVDYISITCDTIDQTENVFRRLEMNPSNVLSQDQLQTNEDLARLTYLSAETCYKDRRIHFRNLQ